MRHIDELAGQLAKAGKTRVHRGISTAVDPLVAADASLDADFARVVSEMRLIKDDWEVAELQEACDITTLGFEDAVREWDRAVEFGERWIEGTFFRRARAMGNDIGYDSIVGGGTHATTLHWIENTGPITPGELVLLDMGVEGHNLYTADVTRTLPVDGPFTALQRDLYDLVLRRPAGRHRRRTPGEPFRGRAQRGDGRARARPGGPEAAARLGRGGARPGVSKVYARWTLHGTSHMLGMDVHDCGRPRRSPTPRARWPRAWC